MNLKQRLRQFVDYKGLSPRQFELSCGLSNGALSKIGENTRMSTLEKISNFYPDLNVSWLRSGVGNMLISMTEPASDESMLDDGIIMIPLFNLDARGGFDSNEEVSSAYVDEMIPFSTAMAHRGDIAIHVYGDSMYPKYPNGTILLIRQIETWYEYVEFGATYVIETRDEQRYVKNVCRSQNDDSFLLKSFNPNYEPAEMPKKLIMRMFRVVASLERNVI